MSKATLGEVIRFMTEKALQSDDKKFSVRLRDIKRQITGIAPGLGFTNEQFAEYEKIDWLKSSYIYNTTSRMQSLKDADKRAKYKIEVLDIEGEEIISDDPIELQENGFRYLTIYIVDGAVKPTEKNRTDKIKDGVVIEKFKERLLKLSPNVLEFEGDELTGAVKAIRMYQEMIKEFK